jgi:hypothetical protein
LVIKFKTVTVNAGWFSVEIPVPYFEWIELDLFRLADSSGGFDYNSIMLYSGTGFTMKKDFPGLKYSWVNGVIGGSVKVDPQKYVNGNSLPNNVRISVNDAKTVKKLQENYFWPW